jgi:AcrR family transcriptional regulator
VSLVSRYFGGKDELFADVLAACPSSTDIFEGDVATFGERLATKLVDDAAEDEDLTCLLIILRSASSPKAREAIRKSGEERFFGPIEEWLGGPDSKVRARLIADIVMGVMIDRVISDNFELGVEERKRFRDRLVRVIQGAIEI